MVPKLNSTSFLKFTMLIVTMSHLMYCPFSKVEESFNTQAIHDILFYGTNLTLYDHNEFPGVVPRTFIGPLIVSFFSMPLVKFVVQSKFENIFLAQLISRFVLGCLVLAGFFHFSSAVRKKFNSNVEKFLILTTISQFHFIFYSTRTLPNTFALVFFLHLYACWLNQKPKQFIWLSAFVILVFRFELAIICGIMLLIALFNRQIDLLSLVVICLTSLLVFIGLSVSIDSYFWNHWVWPEGQVLWFNTILNKSSEWGTSPFLWYFYSALPRALLLSLFLVPLGLFYQTKKTLIYFIVPSVGFLFIYSFLPHKELRFILYVFPILNAVAAKGIEDFRKNRILGSVLLKNLILFSIYAHFVINLLITCGFLHISKLNYPGAFALMKLHELESKETAVNVHIDTYSAQTGVTRFLELNREHGWIYDKTEHNNEDKSFSYADSYSHLLVEAESEAELGRLLDNKFKVLSFVRAYNGIYLNYLNKLPMPKLVRTPKIFILKRKI